MAGLVYFDTDVFHLVGKAFANQPLSAELRERIVVSPITVLEALSHLTLKKNDEILRQIQAIRKWVNPNNAGVLPFPIVALMRLTWRQKELPQVDFEKQTKDAINICLSTASAEELRQSAGKLKDALDIMKDAAAGRFKILVEICKRCPPKPGKVGWTLRELASPELRQRIADYANEDHRWTHAKVITEIWALTASQWLEHSKGRPITKINPVGSAYYEFELERLKVAASNPKHQPDKNDLLDSEQLVYLDDPALHFLTCDRGYLKRVKKSEQARHIHRVSREALADAGKVEALLRKVTE